MAKECNFPDCERKVASRGLCLKHYSQATTARTPSIRDKALEYILAPTRPPTGKRNSAFNSSDDFIADPAQPLTIGALGDAARAAIDESYRALGAKAVKFGIDGCDGMLYVFPEQRQSIWIGPEGRIEPAEIHKGVDNEKIA